MSKIMTNITVGNKLRFLLNEKAWLHVVVYDDAELTLQSLVLQK